MIRCSCSLLLLFLTRDSIRFSSRICSATLHIHTGQLLPARCHFGLPSACLDHTPATARRSSRMEKTGAYGGKRCRPRLLLLAALSWLLMVYLHVAVFHGPPVVSSPPHTSLVAVASDCEDCRRFLLRQEEQLKKMASSSALPAAAAGEEQRRPHDRGGDSDACRGRYVYIHDLPPRFNADIIRNCRKTEDHWGDMCRFLSNAGLGRPLADRIDGVIRSEAGWYDTHQFALDAIFHDRMKQYECLTTDPAEASAVFVPFYAGFDFVRYHWGYDNATRDAASADLTAWLMARPEWRRMGGRDHFLVAGRTGWDFRRSNNVDPDWGNDLLVMPAGRNMSVLVLESAMLHGTDYPVPYPTYFHPRSDADVLRWQERVRAQRRTWLMAFVGAPRPDVPINIRVRDHVIAQCKASRACTMLGCARATGSTQCHTPANIMRLFQKTVFCLQPPGDTCTRRSAFDSMVAGCIPVFFHQGSAYKQYRWHLPDDHHRYSVYIPDADVRQRNVSIEAVLRAIPPETVERMREEVIRLIPRVLYADPRSKLETLKDAVDIAVEGILGTVARIRKGEYVDSGGPVTEDPPNLFTSTESLFRPKQSVQADQ